MQKTLAKILAISNPSKKLPIHKLRNEDEQQADKDRSDEVIAFVFQWY